jgi:hypothetical protein
MPRMRVWRPGSTKQRADCEQVDHCDQSETTQSIRGGVGDGVGAGVGAAGVGEGVGALVTGTGSLIAAEASKATKLRNSLPLVLSASELKIA